MPDKKKVSEIIPFPEDNSTPSETTVLPFPDQEQQPENKDIDITPLKREPIPQAWQQFLPTTMQGHIINDPENSNLIDNVQNGGITLLGQMNQKVPNLVPQQLQKAQTDVKNEIAAGPDYLKNFINNNQQVLNLYDNILKGNPAKTIIAPSLHDYDAIFDKNSGTKELGTFANASKSVINQQYQNKLEELNSQYPSDTREQDDQYQQLKNTLDRNHDQEIKKLQQSVYPLAQLKTASEFIDNNPKYKEGNNPINSDDLLKIGIEQAKATGTPDIDRLERLYHRGQLTEEEKLYFQKAGGDALLYKANDAFADGNKELAQNIYNNTGDYVRKALDANPQAKKEAVIDAISDEISKNKDQYYTKEAIQKQEGAMGYNFLKDITTEKTIEEAAKKIGISPQDYQDIKPDDIKYESSPLQRFGKGFYNAFNPLLDLIGHVAQNSTVQGALTPDIKLGSDIVEPYLQKKLFGGENPNAASLFQTPTIVNTQPGRNYLEQIPNPQQGEFHPTLSNIAGTTAEGIGNIIGFMAPTAEASKALQLSGLIGDAGNANRIATAATVYLSNIENNLQEAKRALPTEGTGKQALLANLYTLSDIIGVELMNPLGIKEKILSPTTSAGQELIDVVKNDGLEGLYRNNNLQKIITKAIDGATEGGKDWARMTGGMTSTEVGRYMADMVLAPEKFKNEDNAQGLVQAAVSNGIVNLLPSIASGISHVNATEQMRNNLVYEVGSNPRPYIDGIDAAQRNGQIEEAIANQKKQLIEKASDIVKNQVPENSLVTGKPLTTQERSEYANNLFIESQLLQQKERTKDVVQDKLIDGKIKDLQDQRKNILEKQPETITEQPNIETPIQQPKNIEDILGAIEEEHPEDIINPKIETDEKNIEASKESGTQEVNANKGIQTENGEGQRQGRVLMEEGVAQETAPSITEPLKTESNATPNSEKLQNEGLPQQDSEPEHPGVEEQRNEATQPETDNSDRIISEPKEINNDILSNFKQIELLSDKIESSSSKKVKNKNSKALEEYKSKLDDNLIKVIDNEDHIFSTLEKQKKLKIEC